MEQQQPILNQHYHCFFTKNNPRRMKPDRDSLRYFSATHSSYLIDVSNKTGSIFLLNKQDLCVIDIKRLEEIFNRNSNMRTYDEYDFECDEPFENTMTRVSPCETMMAIAKPTNIVTTYLPDFLTQTEPKVETNFEIEGSSYTYMEWAPLNEIYCQNPHFLTLDSSGKLRTHFISTDDMFTNLDQRFRCATFSLDGGVIYAINYYQELCIIDPLSVQIISGRRIDELQTSSTVIPLQMMQITPGIMVIGALRKSSQEQIKDSKPYLLLLSGDLLDPKAKPHVVPFKMHLSQLVNPQKLPNFCFHYVKERQLLLFSHTESNSVQALQVNEDGDFTELDSLDLDETATVRGFVFFKVSFSREEKRLIAQVEYRNRRFALPNGPRIFVLDSEGFMYRFNYYDSRYDQSMLTDPIKVEALRGDELIATVKANRTMIISDHLSQKPPRVETGKKGQVIEYQGSCKSMKNWSDESADNPFMLDCILDIGQIFTVNGRKCGITNFNRLDWMLKASLGETGFFEYYAQENKGDIRMVRVSDCKCLIATVYESNVCIQKTQVFLDVEGLKESQKQLEAEFTLSEGGRRYTYLEWAPLSLSYLENPYFLTLDDQGTLRIHYVKDGKEGIVEEGRVFRCASFSLDGRYIYTINEKQEICKIYCGDLKIVIKRKVEGLSNCEEVRSSHFQQLAPDVFAVGSVVHIEPENPENEASFKPCLHIVRGDFSYLKEELGIQKFEMSYSETFDHKKPVHFRIIYNKERKLLFFGHTGSNEVLTLHLSSDGHEAEIDKFSLQGATLRGLFFVRKLIWKKEVQAREQGKEVMTRPPHLLILDSKGFLHDFRYSESQPVGPKFEFYSMNQFLQRQNLLRRRLHKKEKSRGKSQTRRALKVQEKKRSKSQVKMERLPCVTQISQEERQRRIEILKGNHNESVTEIFAFPGYFSPESSPQKNEFKPVQTVVVTPEDRIRKALLFMNKAESDIVFKVEDQEFPAQKSILSERYKFFKNMWTSGMTESYSDVIEIADTKASIFKAFLTYVYLDMILLNAELAFGLFEFAERYLIDDMKRHCEKYLGDILGLDNCFRIFEMAYLYEAASLKKRALIFFQKNLKKIEERNDLEDLPKWSYLHIKRMQWNNGQYEDESEVSSSRYDEEYYD